MMASQIMLSVDVGSLIMNLLFCYSGPFDAAADAIKPNQKELCRRGCLTQRKTTARAQTKGTVHPHAPPPSRVYGLLYQGLGTELQRRASALVSIFQKNNSRVNPIPVGSVPKRRAGNAESSASAVATSKPMRIP
jgi:hypothetical protein